LLSGFVKNAREPLFLPSRLLYLILATLAMIGNLAPAAAETEGQTKNSKAYKIVFQGNAAISEAALRRDAARELEAFDKEGQRPADIDDAAFQLQIAYRRQGYAFAAVDYQIGQRQRLRF
jgi:hypothetical protein